MSSNQLKAIGKDINDSQDTEYDIKKKPKNPFAKLGINLGFVKTLGRLGYRLPTPVQRKCIPIILNRNDLVTMARTGSGKSAAFLLPILQLLGSHSKRVGIRSIIFEPTRELAFQIEKVARQFSVSTDLRICLIVGGSSMTNQFDKLTTNPDLVIACPGRFLQHVIEADLDLKLVETLVLDEADQLFELGLGEQIQFICSKITKKPQIICMSATLPDVLVDFTRVGLQNPSFIRLDHENMLSKTLKLWFVYVRIFDVNMYFAPEKASPGIIIFVASRYHVEFLKSILSKADISSSIGYGSLDSEARLENLKKFSQLVNKVLIVTDIAARGLDLPEVGTVINFDFPITPKFFIHRVGRTARAGRNGIAISLTTKDDLAYLIELSTHVGFKFSEPENLTTLYESLTQNNDFCNQKSCSLISLIPDLSHYIEFVRQALEDPQLETQYTLMLKAYIQYNKIKPSPSKQSLTRAKDLTNSFITFNSCPYITKAAVTTINSNSDVSSTKNCLNIVSPKSFANMEMLKNKIKCGVNVSRCSKEIDSFRKLDYNLDTVNNEVDQTVFVWNSRTLHNQKTVSGLSEISNAKLNLNSDDFSAKLNPTSMGSKKKKYQIVSVDQKTSRVLSNKQIKRRNEAGVAIRGGFEKLGLYDKWVKSSHRYIQKSGETETSNNKNMLFNKVIEKVSVESKSKSFKTNQKLFTNKQKRKAKKLDAIERGVITVGRSVDSVGFRNVSQIQKKKKTNTREKLKQNPHFRKAYRVKRKAQFEKKLKLSAEKKINLVEVTQLNLIRLGHIFLKFELVQ